METVTAQSVEGLSRNRVNPSKRPGKWLLITAIIIIIIAFILGGISYYQATHFNSNTQINGTKVGGLTAEEALKKLKTTVLKNTVYVGKQQIIDGDDMKMAFTEKDLPGVKKLLKTQWTFFPSSKEKSYSIMPSKMDEYRSQTLKKQVEEKLVSLNETLTAPQDAMAHLEEGKIVVAPSIDGEQYDVESLLKDYEKQEYISEIHLEPVYIQPVREDSEIVKNEQKKLQELLDQSVEYKVQDKVYPLKGSEVIKTATVSKDLKVSINADDIKTKVAEINNTQATLNKNFSFKTHSGSVISVKGQGYGWALDVDKETEQLQKAFENGEKSIAASNVIGHGWKGEGYGYDTLTNNGIGDTYAEVSISEQKIWIYKNGQLMVTTNVVTGKHSTGHDTSPGVWYILYKKSPSILTGRELGGKPSYRVEVQYWAPFTNDGQGFHDASFRSNWASNAYLNDGSHGCVNTPPSVMKTVYANLSTYEPVVIY
ncbi:L,D-transpeptidase family protein [Neobacillus dielmonensis]|uniref:L,D-transpeptidase family protein n=1 Tax=Neobacillus dielmonensis TaxID=1347369 RepID=UPI0005A967F8|nr:L,D-transpeptidase family protein [Neobacillus dielmonensis]